MKTHRSLLRGAAVLALAAAIIGSATIVPAASAATLDTAGALDAVYGTMNKPKIGDSDSGIGDIPIIGEVVEGFKDAEPEEIVTGAVQFAGFAAETAVPLIRSFIK